MSDENVGGWKLVSVEPSQFQIQSIQAQTGCDEATARLFWSKLLYWASEPPADLSAHGQPVVDAAMIERALSARFRRFSVRQLMQLRDGADEEVMRAALTAALKGADHE